MRGEGGEEGEGDGGLLFFPFFIFFPSSSRAGVEKGD